jgi:hypothetical protein
MRWYARNTGTRWRSPFFRVQAVDGAGSIVFQDVVRGPTRVEAIDRAQTIFASSKKDS